MNDNALADIHGGPKCKLLPNYQKIVLNRNKVCQLD